MNSGIFGASSGYRLYPPKGPGGFRLSLADELHKVRLDSIYYLEATNTWELVCTSGNGTKRFPVALPSPLIRCVVENDPSSASSTTTSAPNGSRLGKVYSSQPIARQRDCKLLSRPTF